MSKLNYIAGLAFSALVAGVAPSHVALAQGRGNDKGKHEDKKVEKLDKGDHDQDKDHGRGDDKHGLVRSEAGTVVAEPLGTPVRVQRIPPGQAKKFVTAPQAVVVTRQVLLSNGFVVTQVAPWSNGGQVVYYRRGNMGQGRGLGPVQRLYVVPSGNVVQFQSVPQSLLGTILSRLGLQ